MEDLNELLIQHQISSSSDIWFWKDNVRLSFTVKEVRESLAHQIDLNTQVGDFVWNKWASGKSNMFAWRAVENKIPSAVGLRERGMSLPDYTCRLCGIAEESADHVLMQCSFAKQVWNAVLRWVKCPEVNLDGSLKHMLHEIIDIRRGRYIRKAIHAVTLQTIWNIWKIRNEKIFKGKPGTVQKAVEDIKDDSYQGLKQRSNCRSISWQQWCDFNWNM
ncbi:putative reverse transcriptase zinc-binding domain-containing protein [Helianthus annuus]|uniref:uncharacterized protein LOC110913546 n=1 Tax=Helianthus annuus TaxID=4232 RepID=UPI000B8F4D40|nr:uncharacterized protein LOC110913546 [Helianthus annuus]KAJ0454993.1 putative reverse transcriptase zinc-binding domain-containing protein [Helianthus annuus]